MTMQSRYHSLRQEINELVKEDREITLVPVSKQRSIHEIKILYDLGCRDFAENRLDEALEKMKTLPSDIRWHMIGHIQSKKVAKVVAAQFFLIHSVDSLELAQKISKASLKQNLITSILLQANISGEESKQGLSPQEWKDVFDELISLPAIHVKGWMTMAPLTEDDEKIKVSFQALRILRDSLSTTDCPMPILSMGMSHDYRLAIEEGTTMLRIGSQIFGSRSV